MGPNSVKWLITMKSKIVSIKLGACYTLDSMMHDERRWIYKETDVDKLYPLLRDRLVEKLFTTKFKELTTTRFDLPQRCFCLYGLMQQSLHISNFEICQLNKAKQHSFTRMVTQDVCMTRSKGFVDSKDAKRNANFND